MKTFEKGIFYVSRATASLSAIIIVAMMLFTVGDVFLRYAFRKPIVWNFEVQTLLIVAVVYLGISYVQSQQGHIRIDLLVGRLSEHSRAWLRLFGNIVFFCLMSLITWRMGLQAWDAFITNDYLEGIVRISVWPIKVAVTLGTGLLSINIVSRILLDVHEVLRARQAAKKRSGWYFRLATITAAWVLLAVVTVWINGADVRPVTVGWISIVLLFLLLLTGMPIVAATGAIAIWGTFILSGGRAALAISGSQPFQFILSYAMTVVPLFITMGILAGLAGFASNAYEMARRWLQGIPGGLVHATLVGAAMFAAASGVSTAACATFARMVLPEMFKRGVQRALALGAVACSATLAIMIPPSLMLVTYALLTQTSVGKLLIAGVIPGLIEAALYMIMVFVRCKLNPSLIPKVSSFSWRERFTSLPKAWGILFIVIVVMGGIYTGIFTPIEAGAVGMFAAFSALLIARRVGAREISGAFLESVQLTSSILLIIMGGLMFGTLLAQSRLPVILSEFLGGLETSPMVILIAIMLFYLIIGCFMDALSILVITMPIVFPTIVALGFDPIWFGILVTFSVEVALVSPPYGLNLFVMQATVRGVRLGELYRGVSWFLLMDIIRLALLLAFPQLALWLPSMMFK